MQSKLMLDFYGVGVEIDSDNSKLIEYLKSDFSYFDSIPKKVAYRFRLKVGEIPWSLVDGLVSTGQSQNSVTYQRGNIRYNDYYGEALTVYDYNEETGTIYSESASRIHEIAYLLILSRVGKRMDLRGLHKIHAFAVSYNDIAIVGMMPSKCGKTTLFLDLIKDEKFGIISDDTPVANLKGEILSFPLRVGVDDIESLPKGDDNLLYEIDRKQYGTKVLAPLSFFKNRVEKRSFKKIIILSGVRSRKKSGNIYSIGRLSLFMELCRHMVVGIGLPMIIEYFLESSPKDIIRRAIILGSRTISALSLIFKAKGHMLELSPDRESNLSAIDKLIASID